jgi:N4-gp56 family major capsid protein
MAGYNPAGNLSSSAGLPQASAIMYRKKALSRLTKKFVFGEPCMDDTMEKQSGRIVQWYRLNSLAANTTPTTEGTSGTGLTYSGNVIQAAISQFSDFITVSDMLVATSIAPELQNAADLIGERGGLSVDTMTRRVVDAEQASIDHTLSSANSYLRLSDLSAMAKSLQAVDVQPFENNDFLMIIHPFVSYDLINDPAAGGVRDTFKYTNPGGGAMIKGEDRGVVGHFAQTKVIESTNVATTAAGVYRSYFFGEGGLGKVSLSGMAPSKVKDPKTQRFNVTMKAISEPSLADPEGVIGGFASYKYAFVPVVLEGPAGIGGTYRMKTAETKSSIG